MPNSEQIDRVLIIDDDEKWRRRIERAFNNKMFQTQYKKQFGTTATFTFKQAEDYDTAIVALDDQDFEIVTIDMQFETDEDMSGEMVLDYIVDSYPNTACIVISGSVESFAKRDDLEDEYGLRAFIDKGEFSPIRLVWAIGRAKEAVERRLQANSLETELNEYHLILKNIRFTIRTLMSTQSGHRKNLAQLQERAAQFGLDVPVKLHNEIEFTKQKIDEIAKRLDECKIEEADTQNRINQLKQ